MNTCPKCEESFYSDADFADHMRDHMAESVMETVSDYSVVELRKCEILERQGYQEDFKNIADLVRLSREGCSVTPVTLDEALDIYFKFMQKIRDKWEEMDDGSDQEQEQQTTRSEVANNISKLLEGLEDEQES